MRHISGSEIDGNCFHLREKLEKLKYLILTLAFGLIWRPGANPGSKGVERVVSHMKVAFIDFAASTHELKAAIDRIDDCDTQTLTDARNALLNCRLQYKRIAYFLEYFFDFVAITYNAPPQIELEEPSMEFDEPTGLQVIESLLYAEDVGAQKQVLQEQAQLIWTSAMDLKSLLYRFRANDRQLMESIRLGLVRIMTLGITGFDAPCLKSGVRESYESLQAMKFALAPFLETERSSSADGVRFYLDGSLDYLKRHPDFDSFDRMAFLRAWALPLQARLGDLAKFSGLEGEGRGTLNPDAVDLFSTDALRADAFRSRGDEDSTAASARVALGRRLFFEEKLSGGQQRSCATCHDPAKYFSDGLPRSRAIDGHSFVDRNAPTLLYAAFQQNQFWDGRAVSLEAQIEEVLVSPREMNGSPPVMTQALMAADDYVNGFRNAFPSADDSLVSVDHIARAIAAFVRTLRPFDSPFDRYMHGDTSAMNRSQVRGFNLFMGKAQCGTCHFAPLFNGLLPPLYEVSELEVLGAPATASLDHPVPDADAGRFNVSGVGFQRGAFKTPTLRNVAMTAPYMHHGAFGSLETVMDFYNRGGGLGIGLDVDNQTLSGKPLNLTSAEQADIIHFLEALTDEQPITALSGNP